ncbi:outer membrane beta-barrel protein [Aurantibacillus circumpalustris]|uniref:outer membrane beta-barrel protein n=1 Tax=Aurantibacillus circumpalustris TaxID=3036359 RepID=UPI00295A6AA3|nr:outer membrane beta-barrel protein [Aurantibacillus circumpalustris]
MKKLFIFFFMSIICLDVWSQGKLKTQCKFGFKFGSGMQTITGCPLKKIPRIAFMGGIWVQIKISKSWTIQAELTQIGKGTGLGLHQPKYGDYWLNLNYFEVPILFQYNKQNGYFEFGPSLAGLINTGEYIKGGALPYQTDLYPISKKDFSFNLGAGYVFNDKWRVGLRLTHSLLPVRKQLPATSHPVYNRGIILAVSRQINLKALRTRQSQDIE